MAGEVVARALGRRDLLVGRGREADRLVDDLSAGGVVEVAGGLGKVLFRGGVSAGCGVRDRGSNGDATRLTTLRIIGARVATKKAPSAPG